MQGPVAFGLSAALPCGWVWAHAALAAGTGHPLLGALVMFAFWLGTLPMLLGIAAVAAPLLAALRQRAPWVAASLLVALGVAALVIRAPAPPGATATESGQVRHGRRARPAARRRRRPLPPLRQPGAGGPDRGSRRLVLLRRLRERAPRAARRRSHRLVRARRR